VRKPLVIEMENKKYTAKEIISAIDHTVLKQQTTAADIDAICADALKYGTASVCIPPSFVKYAKDKYKELTVCTVIGFPNGYSLPEVKAFEAEKAVDDGADEIDMVINIGLAHEGKWDEITREIDTVKEGCHGRLLKVIVETCLLDREQKIGVCRAVAASKAEFIKTSTGFGGGGATVEDVALFKEYCTGKKIKAAGGIKNPADAEAMLRAGAERLGTSSLLKQLL